MEGELRCEGEERTAAACPATALPTEPPNPPHLAASCRRHQQQWRREKEANARRESEAFVLLSCWRAGCRGSYCDELTAAVWVAAGGRELAQGDTGVARRCRKRHCTSGRREVTLRSPFFCRRRCRGFWSMGMALLLPEPPPVLPLVVSLKSESLWLLRK
ncbi:uncharacterized protein [Arachis hypogaea]|uniref:uncharacterized protein n=1 Tax=Arachis hypogaea TaxID=3818 RepID=UPI000DEC71BC|nr:uncharacterized protein LOC112728684 [Arachis hypogaea]XP_029146774.1 uncharacterized protein LOC112728684 [Arachis hypogaea]